MPDDSKNTNINERTSARNNPHKKENSKAGTITTDSPRAMLIINPVAGAGAATKIWDELQRTLRDLALDFDYRFTNRRDHAVEIAGDAANEGYGIVGVVGGDGTVYEAVNGIMSVARKKRPALGIIPMGSGTGFCRTLEIPRDWLTAASLMVSGRRRTIDVGRMEYQSTGGKKTGYFANIAGLGFDGEVIKRANEMPEKLTKAIGGAGTYLLSLGATYASYRSKDVELQIDGEISRVLATTVIIANCRYFGGKICIAPDADPCDELFDIVVIGAGSGMPVIDVPRGTPPPVRSILERTIARARMARNIPRVYRGTHVKDESVMVARGKKVGVASKERIVLQADGVVIGEGPFAAELVPAAIDVIA